MNPPMFLSRLRLTARGLALTLGFLFVLGLADSRALAQNGWGQDPNKDEVDRWTDAAGPDREAILDAMGRGKNAALEGRSKAALRAFEEVLVLAPDHELALALAAELALKVDELDLALTYFTQLRAQVADADRTYLVCFQLATAYAKLERLDDGITEYDRCHDADPSQDWLYDANKAELYMAAGKLDEAVAFYRASLSNAPGNPYAAFGLAVALDRRGDLEEARSSMLQALSLEPTASFMFDPSTFFTPNGEKHYHLGQIYEAVGRFRAAEEQFRLYVDKATRGRYQSEAEQHLSALSGKPSAHFETYPAPSRDVTATAVETKLKWLAVGTADGRVSAVQLSTNKVIDYATKGARIVDLAFDVHGALHVLNDDGELLTLEPKKSGFKVKDTVQIEGQPLDLSVAATSALTYSDGRFRAWNTQEGSEQSFPAEFDGELAGVAAVSAKHDELILFNGLEGVIYSQEATPSATFWPPSHAIDLEVLPSGEIAVGTMEGILLYGTDGALQQVLLPVSDAQVRSIASDPSGRYLVAVHEYAIELWDLKALN